MIQYHLPPSFTKINSIKLTPGPFSSFFRIRPGVFFYSIGNCLSVWNVQSEELTILRAPGSQKIISAYFYSHTFELVAITAEGSVITWRSTMKGLISKSGWSVPTVQDLSQKFEKVDWSPFSLTCLVQCSNKKPVMLRRTYFSSAVSKDFIIWQTSSDSICLKDQNPTKLTSTITGISISASYIMIQTISSVEFFYIESRWFSTVLFNESRN